MTTSGRVVIIGGHGRIALLTAPRLVAAGYVVEAVVRNPAHADDVAAAGARPVVLDVERADVDTLADRLRGADAVVFSAGAGGGDPARTHAVDFEAATRTMDAAERAGVRRFVMVSYLRAETDVERLDPSESFFPYAKAKHDADAHLRASGLDYTILGPGTLTFEPASGRIRLRDGHGRPLDGADDPGTPATSRENVAEAIAHVLVDDAALRQTRNFSDGDTPIAEALA